MCRPWVTQRQQPIEQKEAHWRLISCCLLKSSNYYCHNLASFKASQADLVCNNRKMLTNFETGRMAGFNKHWASWLRRQKKSKSIRWNPSFFTKKTWILINQARIVKLDESLCLQIHASHYLEVAMWLQKLEGYSRHCNCWEWTWTCAHRCKMTSLCVRTYTIIWEIFVVKKFSYSSNSTKIKNKIFST